MRPNRAEHTLHLLTRARGDRAVRSKQIAAIYVWTGDEVGPRLDVYRAPGLGTVQGIDGGDNAGLVVARIEGSPAK